MHDKTNLTWATCVDLAARVGGKIVKMTPIRVGQMDAIKLYGIPRGGIPAALLVGNFLRLGGYNVRMVEDPKDADFIIDDLVDSGTTARRYMKSCNFGPERIQVLINKQSSHGVYRNRWVIFPWELGENGRDESATDIGARLIQYIGDDLSREGLAKTPERFAKAVSEWFSGYRSELDYTTFADHGGYDQMVIETNIPLWSHCEHHIAPFFGVAHIGYVPSDKIIGLSKLPRLVDHFARRLQVQERLTSEIAGALEQAIQPLGTAVVLQCRHTCMESRGIRRQGVVTTTSAMLGALREDASARAEFLSMIPRP